MKRALWVILLAHVAALPAALAGPPSWIEVPDVAPAPAPPQPAPPSTIPRLPADSLYVITSKVPAFALTVPDGIVAVSADAGPLRIRGKFVGGSGKTETKTFTGAVVFSVEALSPGRAEIIIVKEGAKTAADVYRQQIDCLNGPIPPPTPPGPTPPTPPGPTPPTPPGPHPVKDLRVLIVYESGKLSELPKEQNSLLFSKSFREWLNSKTPRGPHGFHEWGMYDADVDLSGYGKLWEEMMGRPRKSLPWMVLHGGGRYLYEGPLPANIEEAKALIGKHAE